MMSTDFKLLIFDLDGTLVDSAPDIVATVNGLMRARGKAPLDEDRIKFAIGEGLKSLIFKLFPESAAEGAAAASFRAELEAEFLQHYEENLLLNTKVYPGAVQFLQQWKGQISIVTNKNERLAKKTVAGLDIGSFAWLEIFGADSLPERKPHPLPLLETVRRAGVHPHETLMIGDGLPDMRAARAAKIHALGMQIGYVPWNLLKEAGGSLPVPNYFALSSVIEQARALAPLT